MTDLAHNWGQDLQLGPTGGLALATGETLVQQRIIRRLLTTTGDYLQHVSFGAGLGGFVGQPAQAARIAGVVRREMRQEASVSQMPPPKVTVTSDNAGTVSCTISYIDLISGVQVGPTTFALSSAPAPTGGGVAVTELTDAAGADILTDASGVILTGS